MASHESDQVEIPPNHTILKMQIRCMKGQSVSAKSIDALIIMQLNGCFIDIWITNIGFTQK